MPHIRSGVLVNYIPTIEAMGGDVEQVLARANVAREAISNEDNYIAYSTYIRLLLTAAEVLDRPEFGLEMSRHMGSHNLGITGFILSQSETVGDAWRSFSSLYHVHDTYGSVTLNEQDGIAFVRYEMPNLNIPGSRQVLDVAAGIMANIHMALLGENFRSECVLMPYPEPDNFAPFAYLRTKELIFDQPGYATGIPTAALEQPITQSDPRMQEILAKYLDSLKGSAEHAYTHQVEELIQVALPTGRCTIENIARFLSVSVRTLQTRLDKEHTSFKLLLEKTRRKLALQHLSQDDLQLTQLAHMLGYSELSAFSRSFRRWYGCSPRDWQKQSRRLSLDSKP